jgi:hypothetical protein
MNSTTFARLTVLSLVLVSAKTALAQTPCGLHTHYRIVTNMGGATGPGELRLDSGWVTTRPDSLPGSITTTNGAGMESSGSCTATADYGDLRCVASGEGHTTPGNGAFLILDEWIGGTPKAEYSDNFTITSATLPPGTPVDVVFTTNLTGFAQVVDSNPSITIHADLEVNSNQGAGVQTTVNNAGTISGTLHTQVGWTGTIRGKLFAYVEALGLAQAGPRSSTISCNLRATTTYQILTPGATVSTCSAAPYTPCGSADFNGDGDIGTDQDIEAFFACLSGNCCPTCGSADFNGDGDLGTDADIEAFFRVLGGGSC